MKYHIRSRRDGSLYRDWIKHPVTPSGFSQVESLEEALQLLNPYVDGIGMSPDDHGAQVALFNSRHELVPVEEPNVVHEG